jgi:tripartite-type tricarboxylate transporter receptor subunit TctC
MVSSRAPAAVVQKLKETTLAVQKEPDYVAGLAKYGIKISAVGPDGFAKFLHDEAERWRPIVQSISSN